MDQEWSRWRSCHLHYHGDGSLLLVQLVRPLAGSLLRSGAIDRFFFIRYELGGPHVRLRLRAAPGADGALARAVTAAPAVLFTRLPSAHPLPAEVVARRTREILATDPSESDATLHPDNSLRIVPFLPEVDRYGGPALIGASLDFFALSSVRALSLLAAVGGEPRPRQLPWVLRALAALAFGFARDEAELLALLGYAAAPAGHPLAPFAARGDRAYEAQPEVFQRLLQEVLTVETAAPTAAGGAVEEARRLSAEIAGAAPAVRERILRSHLHMTANRLGLRNPEEAYLGRILWRAAQPSCGLDPALRRLWRPAPGRPLDAGERLEDLLPTAFAVMSDLEVPATAGAAAFRGR